MHFHTESETRHSSGPVRRVQSMPHQPNPPMHHSLRRAVTATPVYPTYPVQNQHASIPIAVAYPYNNYTPDHGLRSPVGMHHGPSPIEQQRVQLERYQRSRATTNNNNSTVRTTNFDAEARELEEAIALSLIESTRHDADQFNLNHNTDRVNLSEEDPVQRSLLETTHMTPEELADERALQEAIMISLHDAEMEQERILTNRSRNIVHERSASVSRMRNGQNHLHNESYFSPAKQERSSNVHRTHYRSHEDVGYNYPLNHYDESPERRQHTSRSNYHNESQFQYPSQEINRYREKYPINHDEYTGVQKAQLISVHPIFPAKDFSFERQPSRASISHSCHSSISTSANSSVIEETNKVSSGNAPPVVSNVRAPPPVFKHATLRAPPPLSRSAISNSTIVNDTNQVPVVPVVHPPPPVFGHATLRAPPPLLSPDLVQNGVRHQ